MLMNTACTTTQQLLLSDEAAKHKREARRCTHNAVNTNIQTAASLCSTWSLHVRCSQQLDIAIRIGVSSVDMTYIEVHDS